jgi:hypothetical protein
MSTIVKDKFLRLGELVDGLFFSTNMASLDKDNILVTQENDGKTRLISNGNLSSQSVLDSSVSSVRESVLCWITVLYIQTNNDNHIFVFLYLTKAIVDGIETLGNRVYWYRRDGEKFIKPKTILDLFSVFVDPANCKLKVGLDGYIHGVIGDQNRISLLQNVHTSTDFSDNDVIFRINQDGYPLSTNTFFNRYDNYVVCKYYAYDTRDSFGIAIDPMTRNLWIIEDNSKTYAEINLVKPSFSGWLQIIRSMNRNNITVDYLVILNGAKYLDPKFSRFNTIGVTDIELLGSSGLRDKYSVFAHYFNNGNLYYFAMDTKRIEFNFKDNCGLLDLVTDNEAEISDIVFGISFELITDMKTGNDGHLYIPTSGRTMYEIVLFISVLTSLGNDNNTEIVGTAYSTPLNHIISIKPISIPIKIALIVSVVEVIVIVRIMTKKRLKRSL